MTDTPYAISRARLERFLERDTGRIDEASRTLALDHGARTRHCTILFHGLSASPRQFIAVAQALHERGHNVIAPRLPRHGYRDRYSRALETLDSRQLKACADEVLAIAQGFGERVHVAGFSLGGLLTCYLAQTQPIHRGVAVSPFLGVMLLPNALRMMAVRLALRLPNQFYWWDPILRERQQPAHGYPQYSTHALAHGLTLADEVFQLALVRPPQAESVVLAINPFEPAVNNRAIRRLGRAWYAHKPDSVEIMRLRGLRLVHDIIEPKRYPHIAQRVNEQIVDLIDR